MVESDWEEGIKQSPEELALRYERDEIDWPKGFTPIDPNLLRSSRIIKSFSDDTRTELRALVSEDVIDLLQRSLVRLSSLFEKPKESEKKYLSRLQRALKRLDTVLEDARTDIFFELCTLGYSYPERADAPENIKKYLSSKPSDPFGFELVFFRRDVGLMLKLVELTLARRQDSRGRKRNREKIITAMIVARICQTFVVPVTRYPDGGYFQILAIIFAHHYPGVGNESHRRYANLALDMKWMDMDLPGHPYSIFPYIIK